MKMFKPPPRKPPKPKVPGKADQKTLDTIDILKEITYQPNSEEIEAAVCLLWRRHQPTSIENVTGVLRKWMCDGIAAGINRLKSREP